MMIQPARNSGRHYLYYGGDKMFRGCFFEYNGISSQRYNLMLFYIENDNMKFNSGGNFELKTENLPYSHERLYYGKDYSANPLEFDVEIINPDENITKEQMAEIKNWLFGQDGWKDLALTDDTRSYHLKCVFEPNEDITDSNGYRGVRCKIRNVSPFWYGDEKEISLSNYTSNNVAINGINYNVISIEIPNNDYADFVINPRFVVNVDKTGVSSNITEFRICSCDAETIEDGKAITNNAWDYPNTSELAFSISFIGAAGNSNAYDTLTIDTKYATIESERYPKQNIYPTVNTSNPLPIFRMKYGTNICRFRYGWNYSSVVLKYTPVYRMGAF